MRRPLLFAAGALALAAPVAAACAPKPGPVAGVVRYEYDGDRVHCKDQGHHRFACAVITEAFLDGDPSYPITITVPVWVRWRPRVGRLHGDFAPAVRGFDLSWDYRWRCARRT